MSSTAPLPPRFDHLRRRSGSACLDPSGRSNGNPSNLRAVNNDHNPKSVEQPPIDPVPLDPWPSRRGAGSSQV